MSALRAGVVCTTDRRDKNNIIDAVGYPERIFPVGRLDKDSTVGAERRGWGPTSVGGQEIVPGHRNVFLFRFPFFCLSLSHVHSPFVCAPCFVSTRATYVDCTYRPISQCMVRMRACLLTHQRRRRRCVGL